MFLGQTHHGVEDQNVEIVVFVSILPLLIKTNEMHDSNRIFTAQKEDTRNAHCDRLINAIYNFITNEYIYIAHWSILHFLLRFNH